jgi:hypothetical protein
LAEEFDLCQHLFLSILLPISARWPNWRYEPGLLKDNDAILNNVEPSIYLFYVMN